MRVFSGVTSSLHTLVLGTLLASACSDEAKPAPPPPNRLKTLGELSTTERQELCDWALHRSSLDPDFLEATCTNAALYTSRELGLKCSEQRDTCIRIRRSTAELTPCFLDSDGGVTNCDATLVGEHLDCIEDYRQDTIDYVGGARCGNASSYVPIEDASERREGLVARGAGCRTLAESCPAFFRNWGVMLTQPVCRLDALDDCDPVACSLIRAFRYDNDARCRRPRENAACISRPAGCAGGVRNVRDFAGNTWQLSDGCAPEGWTDAEPVMGDDRASWPLCED